MRGMNAVTGAAIEGEDHLAQSIADILTTPIGSRVMRRDYGSLLFELIDKPFNAVTRALLHAATAIALGRWEPRLLLRRVLISKGDVAGAVVVAIEGERLDRPSPNSLTRLTIPIRLSGAMQAA
ncbi:MAG: oxidoreductase [Alphaproteobacteria bacterium]|nr:MAG: oxidoreductase [Alphaproteobacteria bacterium]